MDEFMRVVRDDADLMLDLDDTLRRVVEAVRNEGGRGTVTLRLAVERPKNTAESVMVYITGTVSSTEPRAVRAQHPYYAVDGTLSRRDPRQPDLPGFRTIDSEDEHPRSSAVNGE